MSSSNGHEAENDIFFASLADGNPGLVWRSGPEGERLFFNKAWLRFTGRTLEQERINGWMSNVYPPHVEKVFTALKKALQAKSNYHVEYQLRAADGKYRWILETGAAQLTESGKLLGMIGWCTDINETRLTQQNFPSMAASGRPKTLPSNTGDHAPLGMWKLDDELIVVKVNPAASDQIGMDRLELLGRRFTEVVPHVPEETLRQVLRKGTSVQLQNQRIAIDRDKEKRLVYWDLDAWPLIDGESVVGVGLSTMEVTDRNLLDQQKEDFVATLVHDLRTPLIGADHTLDSLLGGLLGFVDPEQSEALALLKQSNLQLLTMVHNLIETYRYESGNQRLALEPLPVAEVVAMSLRDLSALAAQKSIILVENNTIETSAILGDCLAIRRVLQNLLGNAIKFSPPGSQVTVSAAENNHFVFIYVTDNGPGISKEDQGRLFKRFAQAQSKNKLAIGTGLGLYLCRQIVSAHSGEITCHSVLNQGSTFAVKLPKVVSQ